MTFAQHEASIVIFLGVLAVISVSNLVGLHRLRGVRCRSRGQASRARVSILVPARNEEANIQACVESLLAQDYPDFEVLVLDDASRDGTAKILAALCADPRLRVFSGEAVPPGWLGKNWACHQLAEAATGEILLFTDADTRHHPQTLGDSVAALDIESVDFLSVLPGQELRTWGERLVVPILPWSQQTFYPIALFRRLRLPIFTTAVGQYMLFRRSAYTSIGGHEHVRASVIDDCDLVRAVAAAGLRWTLLDGTDRVTSRMYSSFREAIAGFTKNLFARFRYNLPGFAFVWIWLLWVAWQPLVVLLLRIVAPDGSPPAATHYAGAAAGLSFLLWLISDVRFRVRLDHVIASPVTLLLAFAIAVRSLAWRALGRGTWKERPIHRSSGRPR